MMSEKLIGYLLLVAGIILIVIAAIQVYLVFTGAQAPLSSIQSQGVSLSISSQLPASEIISGSEISQITNLTIHYLLMTFLVSVGFRISSLGIQLLRPIEVKLGAKQL